MRKKISKQRLGRPLKACGAAWVAKSDETGNCSVFSHAVVHKCEKMYEMRASVFSGPGWIYTRPMYKSAKQCASALKRVLVEEEIGVGNALALVSGDFDSSRKYTAKVARDYKELDKTVKEFVIH